MEIVKLASLTLGNRSIKMEVNFITIMRDYPTLSFDKRRLQQVLQNLMTNARKFTKKGKIAVSGRVKQRKDREEPDDMYLEV